MLAVARALMGRPKLLLLDEPSLGLAPIIVQDLFRRFGEMNAEQGITMLIVEQNANLALDIAHRAYVLEAGQIALSGTADELRNDEAVRAPTWATEEENRGNRSRHARRPTLPSRRATPPSSGSARSGPATRTIAIVAIIVLVGLGDRRATAGTCSSSASSTR